DAGGGAYAQRFAIGIEQHDGAEVRAEGVRGDLKHALEQRRNVFRGELGVEDAEQRGGLARFGVEVRAGDGGEGGGGEHLDGDGGFGAALAEEAAQVRLAAFGVKLERARDDARIHFKLREADAEVVQVLEEPFEIAVAEVGAAGGDVQALEGHEDASVVTELFLD